MAQAIADQQAIAAAKYDRIILQKRCKNQTDNCSICIDSLYMKPVMYLPCKHYFHQACLNQAFEKKLYTCPLCRYDLVEALTKTNFKFPFVYTPYYTYYNDMYSDDMYYNDMPYLEDSDIEEDIHMWTGLLTNILQGTSSQGISSQGISSQGISSQGISSLDTRIRTRDVLDDAAMLSLGALPGSATATHVPVESATATHVPAESAPSTTAVRFLDFLIFYDV